MTLLRASIWEEISEIQEEGGLEAVITAWIRPQGNTLETQGNPMVPTSWSPEHSAVPCTEQEETRH